MIPRFIAVLVSGPLLCIMYKVLMLLIIIPALISTDSRSRHFVRSYEIEDSHVEVTRSVEPQVLARLESKFLKLLGMPRRPAKRSTPLKVPKYLIDLYKAQTGNDLSTSNLHLPGRHTRTANTVRTFYHLPHNTADVRWGQGFKFDLSTLPNSEKVTGAELRLVFSKKDNISTLVSSGGDEIDISELDKDSMGGYKSVRVVVNDVIKPPKNTMDEPHMFPIDTKFIDLSKRKKDSFWITFDVFPAVSRWLENPKLNHGLVIQVIHPNGQVMSQSTMKHIRVRRDVHSPSSFESDPVLFTYSDDGVNKKQRNAKALTRAYRSANGNGGQGKRRKAHRNKNRKRNLCARHKMFVDFTDVGWNDWIVAPPGYHAFHCAGECPYPMADHLNATNHAVIQALVNSMNPQMVPSPCCVPTVYSSLSLLYTDSTDSIVLKNYNEMIVDACGCS